MAAYVLFQCVGRPDADDYDKYKLAACPTLKSLDVKVLALHPELEQVEGTEATHNIALIQFPNFETARAWYYGREYQAIIGLRKRTGRFNAFIFKG